MIWGVGGIDKPGCKWVIFSLRDTVRYDVGIGRVDGMVDCCSRLTCVGVNFSRYKVKSVTLEEVAIDWG